MSNIPNAQQKAAPGVAGGRVVSLDLLRVIAIFGMMVLHVLSLDWSTYTAPTLGWQVANVYDSLFRFCVPVFVMLSGAFFLQPQRPYSFRKLFSKNILRLVTAFVGWSLLYALCGLVSGAVSGGMTAGLLRQCVVDALTGHYHLWFLFTLLGLYLIVPFLRRIAEHKTLCEYFMLLSLAFALVMPTLSRLPVVSQVLPDILGKANFYFVLGYPGYFLAGYYLYANRLSERARRVIYLLGAAGLLLTIVGTALLFWKTGEPKQTLYAYLLPNTAAEALAVFVFFRQGAEKWRFSARQAAGITLLSQCGFGMYLVHDFFNMLLRALGWTPTAFFPLVSVPLLSVAVFLASLCVTLLLRRIPWVNRYMM